MAGRESPFQSVVKIAREANFRRDIGRAVEIAKELAVKHAEERRADRAFAYLAGRMREINGRIAGR